MADKSRTPIITVDEVRMKMFDAQILGYYNPCIDILTIERRLNTFIFWMNGKLDPYKTVYGFIKPGVHCDDLSIEGVVAFLKQAIEIRAILEDIDVPPDAS